MDYQVTSLILQTQPDQQETVMQYIHSITGAEIHGASDDGQLVVTIESEGQTSGVEYLNTIPGVLSVSLVSHHIDSIETP
ncbi:MAG: chaperone NapD [Ferrimonas sp.]